MRIALLAAGIAAVVEDDGVQADLKQILTGINLGDLIIVFVKAQTLGTLPDDERLQVVAHLRGFVAGERICLIVSPALGIEDFR